MAVESSDDWGRLKRNSSEQQTWEETSDNKFISGLHEDKLHKSLCQMERMTSYLTGNTKLSQGKSVAKKQGTSVNCKTIKSTFVKISLDQLLGIRHGWLLLVWDPSEYILYAYTCTDIQVSLYPLRQYDSSIKQEHKRGRSTVKSKTVGCDLYFSIKCHHLFPHIEFSFITWWLLPYRHFTKQLNTWK